MLLCHRFGRELVMNILTSGEPLANLGTRSLDQNTGTFWILDQNIGTVWSLDQNKGTVWKLDQNICTVWSLDQNAVWSLDQNTCTVWFLDQNLGTVWSLDQNTGNNLIPRPEYRYSLIPRPEYGKVGKMYKHYINSLLRIDLIYSWGWDV